MTDEREIGLLNIGDLTSADCSTCAHALEGTAAASRLGNTEPKLRTPKVVVCPRAPVHEQPLSRGLGRGRQRAIELELAVGR